MEGERTLGARTGVGRAGGVEGFLSVGRTEEEGTQDTRPVRQGAVMEAADSLTPQLQSMDRASTQG